MAALFGKTDVTVGNGIKFTISDGTNSANATMGEALYLDPTLDKKQVALLAFAFAAQVLKKATAAAGGTVVNGAVTVSKDEAVAQIRADHGSSRTGF